MRSKVASCRNKGGVSVPLSGARLFLFLGLALALQPLARAATGDGKIVYTEAGQAALRTRDYDNVTSNNFGAQGNATTLATVNESVVLKTSPVVEGEYIAASYRNTTNDSLYISRYNPGTSSWAVDISNQAGMSNATAFQNFDVAYEQESGNALVVYSNGATTNEISYYYYVAQNTSWIGPCTLNSNRTTGVVEWIQLASSKSANNPNEIALAFSDANDDLNAFIWTPTTETPADCAAISAWWGDEPAALLTNDLSTVNTYKFDIAYENTSGDVMLAWYLSATADLKYATNAGNASGWSAVQTDTNFNNVGTYIDLCERPSSDNLAVASLTSSGTSADTETAIWTGSVWGNISTDLDAAAEDTAGTNSIACGWVGTSGRVIVVYDDEETTDADMDWILWNTATWAVQTDVTYGGTVTQERWIRIENFPGEDKILVAFTNAQSDVWAATCTTTACTLLDGDTGTGGTQALATGLTTVAHSPPGVALTALSATPVAEILTVAAQKSDEGVKLVWNSKTESRITGFQVSRAAATDELGKPVAQLEFKPVTEKRITAKGGNIAGAEYSWTDTSGKEGVDYVYKLEVMGRGERVVQTLPPIAPDPTGRVTYVDPKSGKVETAKLGDAMDIEARRTRTGESVALVETKSGVSEMALSKTAAGPAVTLGPMLSLGPTAKRQIMLQRDKLKELFKKKVEVEFAPDRTEDNDVKKKPDDKPGIPEPVPVGPPAIKLYSVQQGMHRVTGQQLADAGWDLAALDPATLRLSANGETLPIRLVGAEDGRLDVADTIEYFGEPVENRFYKTNVYWLSQTKPGGPRMGTEDGEAQGGQRPASYREKVRVAGNAAYYAESPSDAHWFFETELLSPALLDVTVPVDELMTTSDPARLRVGLQGLSAIAFGDNEHKRHRVLVYVNNTLVGDQSWDLDIYVTLAFDVPSNLLLEGDNTVTLEATDESGTLEQFVLADFVELEYARALISKPDGLVFKPGLSERATYGIKEFPSAEALAYALRGDGAQAYLKDVKTIKESVGYQVRFGDRSGVGDRYVVLAPDGFKTPSQIEIGAPSTLKKGALPAYVMLAPKALLESLKDFALHRQAKLVDVQDVYDEFGNGLPDPRAIRDFLVSASERGTKMALLVGDGHYDYRDFQGSGVPEYIPVAMVPGKYGETVSDAWFATPRGELVPRLAVGRWPVQTTDQIAVLIVKTLASEEELNERDSLLVTDDEPVFRSTMDKLAALLPQVPEPVRLDYGELDAVDLKEQLIDGINGGVAFLTYTGHGGVQLWSSAQFFKSDDIASLTNANRYPVLLALGCLSGFFAQPTGMDSLSEELLLAADKGIAATLSPSGLTSTPEQQVLSEAWLKAAVEDRKSLGEALLAAQVSTAAQLTPKEARYVIQNFNLLGDPALTLRLE